MVKRPKAEILIVDDSPENIDILNSILNDDYIIRIALTGYEAIEICNSKKKPDLIILDIVMPELDGFEVLKLLKANNETANIPVIVITIKDSPDDEYKGLELGAIDFISRPFNPLIVKMRVNNIIKIIEADKFKDEVSQIMKHDIRTPLTIIQYEAEDFLSTTKDVPPVLKAKLENIINSVYEISNLLNVWGMLFQIERGNYDFFPQRIDIVKTIKKIIEHVKIKAKAHKIKLLFDSNKEHIFIDVDESLIYPIISNLLKNAIEAEQENSIVNISVISDENGKTQLIIHNKKPIPEEIRNNFFDKFVTFGKKKGTGLGSYSAKLFAEIMGGKMLMKTNETDGTFITFEI